MKIVNKRDYYIILIIIIIAALLALFFNYEDEYDKKIAHIYYKSEMVSEITLHEGSERIVDFIRNPNISFKLHTDGSISFDKSDCPDQVCVNTGRLKNHGATAACIPNEIIIKIKGIQDEDDESPDMIVGFAEK